MHSTLTPESLDTAIRPDGSIDWAKLMVLQDSSWDPSRDDPYELLTYSNPDDEGFWKPFEFGERERLRHPSDKEIAEKKRRDGKSQQG